MKKCILTVFIMLSNLLLITSLFAQDNLITNYTVELLVGDISVSHNGGSNWIKTYVYMELSEKDLIKTGPDSYCEITLPNDNGSIRVMENTVVSIAKSGLNFRSKVSIGKVLFDIIKKLGTKETFEVETETAVVAVRGTEFFVESDAETGSCSVVRGQVAVKRNITVRENESFSKEAEEAFTANAGENQQIEYTKTENREIISQIEKNKGRPDELRKILIDQRKLALTKLHPIREREKLFAILKKHQDERKTIMQRRPLLKQKRLEQLKQKRAKILKRQGNRKKISDEKRHPLKKKYNEKE